MKTTTSTSGLRYTQTNPGQHRYKIKPTHNPILLPSPKFFIFDFEFLTFGPWGVPIPIELIDDNPWAKTELYLETASLPPQAQVSYTIQPTDGSTAFRSPRFNIAAPTPARLPFSDQTFLMFENKQVVIAYQVFVQETLYWTSEPVMATVIPRPSKGRVIIEGLSDAGLPTSNYPEGLSVDLIDAPLLPFHRLTLLWLIYSNGLLVDFHEEIQWGNESSHYHFQVPARAYEGYAGSRCELEVSTTILPGNEMWGWHFRSHYFDLI